MEIIKDGEVVVTYQQLLTEEESQRLFDTLIEHTIWSVDQHTRKDVGTPRLVGCYTTIPGLSYMFGKNRRQPQTCIPELESIWTRVEEATNSKYNFVLVNRYNDGSHSLGWHSDQASNLVPDSSIASISLGQPRVFQFKRKDNTHHVSQILDNGSLLVMNYQTQDHYLHRVPKDKSTKSRINLTFRHVRDYEIIQ